MIWLAWLFLGFGVADLAQAVAGRRGRRVGTAAGIVSQVGVATLSASPTLANALALLACIVALVAWRATHRDQPPSRGRAMTGLTAGIGPALVGIGCAGLAPRAGGPLAAWLASIPLLHLDAVAPDRALLLLACALLNLETANLLVRDTLIATGVSPLARTPGGDGPALLGTPRLRGGRALGAMERLLILGFGAGGNLASAGLVVAAKGLIRFPELTAASHQRPGAPRIDEVTEYFLIGSFASLLVALATVALTA